MVLNTRPSAVNIIQTRSQSSTEGASGSSAPSTSTGIPVEVSVVPVVQVTNMATSLRMETFSGEMGVDIEQYLKRFEQYCQCLNLKDEQALAQLAWHLTGMAQLYYNSLAVPPTELKTLKDLLKEKFKLEKPVNLSIFSLKQDINESVEAYLNRLEAETFKTKINDDLQVQIALSGLLPVVSSAISTHGPKTLGEVRQLARRLTNIRQTAPVAAISSQPTSSMEATVNALTSAVAQLTTIMTKPQQHRTQPNRQWQHQQNMDHQPNHQQQSQACPRCGGGCKSIQSCRAWGKTCNLCGLKNHFKYKCRSGRNNYQNQNSS